MLGSESLIGALWLICALGAAVFAAVAPASRGGLAWLAVGFAGGAVAVRWARLPEPGELAVAVALLAALQLLRPRYGLVAAVAAGVAAGVWSRVLQLQGAPLALAVLLAAALPGVSIWLAAHRPGFASLEVRDEALAALFVAAILAALAPEVLDGWRAARALNIEEPALGMLVVPAWAAVVSVGALAGGGMYAMWRRR